MKLTFKEEAGESGKVADLSGRTHDTASFSTGLELHTADDTDRSVQEIIHDRKMNLTFMKRWQIITENEVKDSLYIYVDDGTRLFRGHWIGKNENTPKYKSEMCRDWQMRRRISFQKNYKACGLTYRGYENNDFNTFIQLILKDIEAKGDK